MVYTEADEQRLVPERPKSPARSPYARDRARVLHSSALRRLSDKTQVFGPGGDDFSRNRLTHSLEVAQVGRDLAAMLGCDQDVVETACLAHDLGHPPFGHNGEKALDEVCEDIGGFEGNAQTLRLLTRLEPKVTDPETGAGAGLNLTRATLDAATKYPWPRVVDGRVRRKFGVYDSDLPTFAWLRRGAAEHRRCVEAQVMDLADDIAYSVHDVEDAVVGGFLDPAVLNDADGWEPIADRVREWYLPDATDEEVADALRRLTTQPWWTASFDPTRAGLAALKNTTSQLIGRFIVAAVEATRERTGSTDPINRYDADVALPRATELEIVTLKGITSVFVMTARDREDDYVAQRRLLTSLVEFLTAETSRGAVVLEAPFHADHLAAPDEETRRRVVVDQVASLTDVRALAWGDRFGL